MGLYYYNARWYDPYIQRWISPDTIVPNPANPQSLNRYSYVSNNPVRFVDPTGHREEEGTGSDEMLNKPWTDEERIAMARTFRPSAPVSALPVAATKSGSVGEWGVDAYKKDGKYYCHPGVDFGGGGKTAQATYDGIVVAAGDFTDISSGFGSGVIIRHPGKDNAYTAYYHMRKDSIKVKPGDVVLAGDALGLTGNTGTKAAHLHFEILRPDTLSWDKDGDFSYGGKYYPYDRESLDVTRISPSQWFGSTIGTPMEKLNKCP